MQVEYINPFIESVYELFSTMLGCEAKRRGDIGLARTQGNARDISALIGLSGPARGIVSLSFPATTALSMVSRLIGSDTRVIDDTVIDAVAELVNIVAGGAKAKLTGGGTPIDLSLPTVVRGSNYSVDYPSKAMWLDIPFTSELGNFSLRVTLEIDKDKGETK